MFAGICRESVSLRSLFSSQLIMLLGGDWESREPDWKMVIGRGALSGAAGHGVQGEPATPQRVQVMKHPAVAAEGSA